ncbi:MAG: preprotein translocase subunit YajC [Lachnospiraceae bacterium]|nr:preprotein translocase subunit YajC [Lachnospiraceae bacterium]
MSILMAAGQTTGTASGGGLMMIVWIVVLVGFMYFFMIRPQQKETKKKNEMMNQLAVGDTVLTTSGFYGTIIDVNEDTVIIEFGSNRNCRIPMQRSAIAAIEKPEQAVEEKASKDDKKETTEKKGFSLFGKKKEQTEDKKESK